ncbi:helix-turn-helix domain-containing protein, partial [Klebsiella pneumoniae]
MLNRMEMIRIFCSAADCSNFREAATRLGVSPQAVTRAIKALEEELGEILFHRNTRQVHITAFGEAYA